MAERDVDIDRLFESGAEAALKTYLRLLHPADIAELFNYVDLDDWLVLSSHLEPDVLAEVLTNVDEKQRARLGAMIETADLIRALRELETDDAADVLQDLPENKSAAVLEGLEDKQEIRSLLAYPEDSAGGIMQTEVCRVRAAATVAEAIEAVRAARDAVDDVLEVYVVDDDGKLVGAVDIEDLLVSNDGDAVSALMKSPDHVLTPDIDQEEVAQIFGKYDVPTRPVVNEEGILLGRITFDDVHDVLEEEASEDIMTMAGVSTEELVYGSNVVRIAMVRLPWLVSSLIGSLVTGFLLAKFSRFADSAFVMAAFVPMLMAMTGNVGTQSAMIVTRGFVIGRVEFATIGRTFMREVGVGIVMGITAGCVVGLTAVLWRGAPIVGLAVGVSMMCSMTMAAFVGVFAPVLFKRVGVDPAIAAGPLVTTGCDMMGVGIYLYVAIMFLS